MYSYLVLKQYEKHAEVVCDGLEACNYVNSTDNDDAYQTWCVLTRYKPAKNYQDTFLFC